MPDNLNPLSKVEKEKISESSPENLPENREKQESIRVQERSTAPEQSQERKIEGLGLETGSGKQEISGIVAAGNAQLQSEEQKKKIEKIMEKDLEELYLKMPDYKKQQFKQAGEQTARQINAMMQSAKVKVGKIIDLLKKWLSLIPGVNKFFLEQEAKIKADEIMKIKS